MKQLQILLFLYISTIACPSQTSPTLSVFNPASYRPATLSISLQGHTYSILKTPLLTAVKEGHHLRAQNLLRSHNNHSVKENNYAVIFAALNNDIPMIQLLKQYGVKIDPSIITTKLRHYCPDQLPKSLETINYLLDHGSLIKNSLFSPAAHREYTELLLEHGADVNQLHEGITPLLMAAEQDNSDTIALYLFHGAYAYHEITFIYALHHALDAYSSQWISRTIESKSLEELCKRGAYITKEGFKHTVKISPKMKKHPKALQRLLQQCAALVQNRLETKQELLDQKNLPQVLIDLVNKFEVGPEADYSFLLEKASN